MKRRHFLVTSVLSAASAAVFTATGWLMGARALTMNPVWQKTPQPYPTCCSDCKFNLGEPYNLCADSPWPNQECDQSHFGVCVGSCYEYYCCYAGGTWCGTLCFGPFGDNCCYSGECN